MIEILGSFIGRVLGWLLPAGWKYAFRRWFRPSIEDRKAPSNFFEHISPGVSKDRAKEVLGPPHRIVEDTWFYRFTDALIQIEYWEGNGAKSVALALTNRSPKAGFKLPTFEKPLGQISLADAMQEEGELEYRSTLRTEEILWRARIGPAGAWLNYTFGALSPNAPGCLKGTSFKWNYNENKLSSIPADVLINWIGISDSSEELWFDWSLALPGNV